MGDHLRADQRCTSHAFTPSRGISDLHPAPSGSLRGLVAVLWGCRGPAKERSAVAVHELGTILGEKTQVAGSERVVPAGRWTSAFNDLRWVCLPERAVDLRLDDAAVRQQYVRLRLSNHRTRSVRGPLVLGQRGGINTIARGCAARGPAAPHT